MYKVFKICVDEIQRIDHDISSDVNIQKEEIKGRIKELLLRHKRENNYVFESEEIIRTCFPDISGTQVFISHSHKDVNAVWKLTSYLENNFKLKCFVDSSIWFDVYELAQIFMSEIDCSNRNIGNILLTHVIMMLTTSLTRMIDKCPIIIFVTSNNSQTNLGQFNNMDITTQSPWIFHELSMMEKLPKKSPSFDYRLIKKASENISFNYHINPSQMIELTYRELSKMESMYRRNSISSESLFCYYSAYLLAMS